jgi:hypothetical protein
MKRQILEGRLDEKTTSRRKPRWETSKSADWPYFLPNLCSVLGFTVRLLVKFTTLFPQLKLRWVCESHESIGFGCACCFCGGGTCFLLFLFLFIRLEKRGDSWDSQTHKIGFRRRIGCSIVDLWVSVSACECVEWKNKKKTKKKYKENDDTRQKNTMATGGGPIKKPAENTRKRVGSLLLWKTKELCGDMTRAEWGLCDYEIVVLSCHLYSLVSDRWLLY